MNATSLPLSHEGWFITDGGLETTLVFQEKLDLPCFAAFPLVLTAEGSATLSRYFSPYLDLARRRNVGFILDTPTWRANPDWAERLGYDGSELDRANQQAVRFAIDQRAAQLDAGPIVVNGVIGPRGDGYLADTAMTAREAAGYHTAQLDSFKAAGIDMVTAVTMTNAEEAIGIALAAKASQLPVAISFTVETDGRLPSGETLPEAIKRTDATTAAYPLYYMVNCAHPSHFAPALQGDGGEWLERIGGVRANASAKSHAELDAATELDRGDPEALGRDYATLRRSLPRMRVIGGCCGTDHEHVGAICRACL